MSHSVIFLSLNLTSVKSIHVHVDMFQLSLHKKIFFSIPKFCQVKNEGYDGREANVDSQDEEPSQWNLPGSLLYSVTIITTIGSTSMITMFVNYWLLQYGRLRSHSSQNYLWSDCHHGICSVRIANIYVVAQQCWYSSGPDFYIPLCQCLLLCL